MLSARLDDDNDVDDDNDYWYIITFSLLGLYSQI